MGQPVVLPKFELPGDKPHWAIRAAWITGGLLLVSVLALGAVISHHRNLETQADIARTEAVARVRAEADAKVAAIAAVAKAQREAELEAKVAARLAAQAAIPATTVPGPRDGSDPTALAPKSAKAGHNRRYHSSHGGRAMGTHPILTASKTGGRSEGKSASNKPDAIDELLRKMDKTK
jgi:hypothetical protein